MKKEMKIRFIVVSAAIDVLLKRAKEVYAVSERIVTAHFIPLYMIRLYLRMLIL